MPAQTLTLSEASYVLGRPAAVLNKAVDTGVIRARQRRVGKAVQRVLGPAELRFLRLDEELDRDLTPTGRRRLYDALRRLSSDSHRMKLGNLELDLALIDDDLKARLDRLDEIRGRVELRGEDSDAVIRGTEVPVHLIAALAGSQTIDEVLEDLPSLDREQVVAAIEYAKAYPKRGRPYAVRSMKRMLSDLAELGAFDESDSPGEAAPRKIP